MLRKIFRGIFTVAGILAGLGIYSFSKGYFATHSTGGTPLSFVERVGVALTLAIICGLLFFKIYPLVQRNVKALAKNVDKELSSISANRLALGTVGLIIGLLLALLISRIYVLITTKIIATILTVITYIIFGYLGIFISVQRGREVVSSFGLPISRQVGRKVKGSYNVPKILDTSVIIDGRIADILRSGFLEGPIIIPDFVLLELQYIADSSDSLKRVRGRRGLDILNSIQNEFGIEIYDSKRDKNLEEIPEVDIKLLKLAKTMQGKVMTNDFNLNKVARIEEVSVLNVNELANMLKPVVLPGEKMRLLLVREGKEREQALAYLDDGTMIVVEDGKKFIGKTIDVEVTTVLQTSAGRMIFAKPVRH